MHSRFTSYFQSQHTLHNKDREKRENTHDPMHYDTLPGTATSIMNGYHEWVSWKLQLHATKFNLILRHLRISWGNYGAIWQQCDSNVTAIWQVDDRSMTGRWLTISPPRMVVMTACPTKRFLSHPRITDRFSMKSVDSFFSISYMNTSKSKRMGARCVEVTVSPHTRTT